MNSNESNRNEEWTTFTYVPAEMDAASDPFRERELLRWLDKKGLEYKLDGVPGMDGVRVRLRSRNIDYVTREYGKLE